MYQHVMVPLDGSKLAECVIPHVTSIAGGCEAGKVTFVRVVTPFHLRERDEYRIPPEERKRLEADSMKVAQSYLDQIVKQSKLDNVPIQTKVLFGDIVGQLLDFTNKNDVDLVVIATHGRSGPSRWVWGSTADRLLRTVCVPVFMVRPPGCIVGF